MESAQTFVPSIATCLYESTISELNEGKRSMFTVSSLHGSEYKPRKS